MLFVSLLPSKYTSVRKCEFSTKSLGRGISLKKGGIKAKSFGSKIFPVVDFPNNNKGVFLTSGFVSITISGLKPFINDL